MFTKIKNFVKSIYTIIFAQIKNFVKSISTDPNIEQPLTPDTTSTIKVACFECACKLTGKELAQRFSVIPRSITTLELIGNLIVDINEKTATDLDLAFTAIPPSITTLKLAWGYLNIKEVDELVKAFRAIPASVKNLDLSYNNLADKTVEELQMAFRAIPPSVEELNLLCNHFYKKTGAELALAFAAIPTTVTNLNLRENNLYKKTGTDLALAFAAIPTSVKTLDLSGNHLFRKTGYELERILKAIPDTVTKIIIGTEITIRSSETKEARIASVARPNNMNMITEDQLKMGCQITRGLYFYGEGLLARPAGFDKEKTEKAILCLMKARAEDKKTGKLKAINLPYDMALKSIGQYLTPVDMAKLTMTCKPLMLQ